MNTLYTTVIVSDPPTPVQLYRLGWNRFYNGEARTACENDHERRGWNAASRAEAETHTEKYASNMNW